MSEPSFAVTAQLSYMLQDAYKREKEQQNSEAVWLRQSALHTSHPRHFSVFYFGAKF